MIQLNAAAELAGRPFAEVAREFLQAAPAGGASAARPLQAKQEVPATPQGFTARLLAPDLPRLLAQHLALVLGSLALAVAVAVPLGIAAHRLPRLAGPVMAGVGLLQTLPLTVDGSLATLLTGMGFNVTPSTPGYPVLRLALKDVAQILPYLLMVLILIFRPKGLLGTRED